MDNSQHKRTEGLLHSPTSGRAQSAWHRTTILRCCAWRAIFQCSICSWPSSHASSNSSSRLTEDIFDFAFCDDTIVQFPNRNGFVVHVRSFWWTSFCLFRKILPPDRHKRSGGVISGLVVPQAGFVTAKRSPEKVRALAELCCHLFFAG